MSFRLNGVDCTDVYLNGVNCSEVYLNGVGVITVPKFEAYSSTNAINTNKDGTKIAIANTISNSYDVTLAILIEGFTIGDAIATDSSYTLFRQGDSGYAYFKPHYNFDIGYVSGGGSKTLTGTTSLTSTNFDVYSNLVQLAFSGVTTTNIVSTGVWLDKSSSSQYFPAASTTAPNGALVVRILLYNKVATGNVGTQVYSGTTPHSIYNRISVFTEVISDGNAPQVDVTLTDSIMRYNGFATVILPIP